MQAFLDSAPHIPQLLPLPQLCHNPFKLSIQLL
jgi:hypothetical protein